MLRTMISRLSDLGISHAQSHRWQAAARVPEQQFENWITDNAGCRQGADQRRRVQGGALLPGEQASPYGLRKFAIATYNVGDESIQIANES